MSITLRNVGPDDAAACARICYDAFGAIAGQYNYPSDIPSMEMATGMAQAFIAHPEVVGRVAEDGGQVIGCNFLDRKSGAVGGVGPMVVDPAYHGRGAGRLLMQAIVSAGEDLRSVRLVQDAHNAVSMSLYASLGFDVKEPLVLIRGKLAGAAPAAGDATVRPMTEKDLPQCAALCERAHGFDRTAELRDALATFQPHVLERPGGRIAAYASSPFFWILNHGVAATEGDMRDLLLGISAATPADRPIELLLPTRQGSLFRWLLSQRLRVMKSMNLMSMRWYQEPTTCWYPSVEY